jgi:hypothetical protein
MEEIRIPRVVREALIENENVIGRFRFPKNKVYLTNGRLLCKRGWDVVPLRYSGITSAREDYERNWKIAGFGAIFVSIGIIVIGLAGRIQGIYALLAGSFLLFTGLLKRNYLAIFQALPYGMEMKSLRTGRVMAKRKEEDKLTSIKLKASRKRINEFLNSFNRFIGSGRIGQANCLTVGGMGRLPEGRVGIVEASVVKGWGRMTSTGLMERDMEESTRAAVTYVRDRAGNFGVNENFAIMNDIHIHAPEAIEKEGPSAGVSIACALISTLTNKPVPRDIAMTGEITIKGDVLPIGGVPEKVLGAYEGGIRDVILPVDNQPELTGFLNINRWLRDSRKQLRKMYRTGSLVSGIQYETARIENFEQKRRLIKNIKRKKLMNFHFVENLDQAVKIALPELVSQGIGTAES